MFKIGITGAIGSGKTTVSRIFESLGVPVYFADVHAKRILNYPAVTNKVCEEFGDNMLGYDGKIDRQKLASQVFTNDEKLKFLNKLIHPLVKQDFECWLSLQHESPYILHEAAIMIESGFSEFFNRIIVVSAPENIRYQRVMIRDRVNINQAKERAEKQWTESEKLKFADFVILNDNEHLVIPQVLALHKEILKLL